MAKKRRSQEKILIAEYSAKKAEDENKANDETSVIKETSDSIIKNDTISTSEEKNKPTNDKSKATKINLSADTKISKSVIKSIENYHSEKRNVTVYYKLLREVKRFAIDNDIDYSTAISYFTILGMKKEGYL